MGVPRNCITVIFNLMWTMVIFTPWCVISSLGPVLKRVFSHFLLVNWSQIAGCVKSSEVKFIIHNQDKSRHFYQPQDTAVLLAVSGLNRVNRQGIITYLIMLLLANLSKCNQTKNIFLPITFKQLNAVTTRQKEIKLKWKFKMDTDKLLESWRLESSHKSLDSILSYLLSYLTPGVKYHC